MPEWLLNILELFCVLVLLTGIAFIYWPAALIVGGALGIWIFEAHDSRLKAIEAAKAKT